MSGAACYVCGRAVRGVRLVPLSFGLRVHEGDCLSEFERLASGKSVTQSAAAQSVSAERSAANAYAGLPEWW